MKCSNLDKIFVIHYTKLIDRKMYLKNKFKSLNINVKWVDKFDREIISEKQINTYYHYDNTIKSYPFNNNILYKPLRIQEIAVWIAHCYCYKQIVKNNWDKALILEDDVLFDENDFMNLYNICNKLPNDWNICDVGNGCNLMPKNLQKNKTFYKTNFGIKTTSSYLINYKTAKFLLERKLSTWVIDYYINLYKNELNIYWAEPPIFKQGSQNGIYKTSVQDKDELWNNPIYVD